MPATQPSQPADSAFCQRYTLALPRLRVFSVVHAEVYTQSMNSKSLPGFNSSQIRFISLLQHFNHMDCVDYALPPTREAGN